MNETSEKQWNYRTESWGVNSLTFTDCKDVEIVERTVQEGQQ